MSDQWQDPYQPPQIETKPPGQPVMPATVKVFGILNLIMAGFGLCGSCVGLVPMFMDVPNPALDVMKESDFYFKFTIVISGIGFILIAMLAAAGVGLLKNQSWGRSLSVVYAVTDIVLMVVYSVLTYIYLVLPLWQKAGELNPGPEQASLQIGAISTVFGILMGFIYPVLLWIFMTRPKVVEALRQASGK